MTSAVSAGACAANDATTLRMKSVTEANSECCFTCESNDKAVHLTFHAREGSYVPWWKFFEVVIYDWPSAHAEAKFSSSTYPLKTSYDVKQHALHMTLADVTADAELTVRGRSTH